MAATAPPVTICKRLHEPVFKLCQHATREAAISLDKFEWPFEIESSFQTAKFQAKEDQMAIA